MSPAADNNFLNSQFEIVDMLQAANEIFYRAVMVIDDAKRTTPMWISYDMYLSVQEKEGDPWTVAAHIYKEATPLPKIRLSGFQADAKLWSAIRGALLSLEKGRGASQSTTTTTGSPSSAGQNAMQTTGNSSPYSDGSFRTPGYNYTSATPATTPTTPSQQATRPLVAFADDTPRT